jgi:mercuric reductase|nr:mercuric reductase, MerA [uncultured bacterium]
MAVAELEQLELNVQGMTCESCALHVEKALEKVEGVRGVRVPGWESGRAEVTAASNVTDEELASAVRDAGYRAQIERRKPLESRSAGNGRADGGYDLMVIGGGSAGFAAAIKGAELGFNVALVEAGTIGGTCVNVGCVPSKTLIRAMEQFHLAGEQRFRGVRTTAGHLMWPQVVDQKDKLVSEMRQSKYADVLAAYPEITYIKGRARLTGDNGVQINGESFTPNKIVIATGAHPWAPPIPGLRAAGYLTSTMVMELRELPDSLIVLGGNAVGLELAQTFARAGTYVTLVELLPRIAPFEDEDISAALTGYLEGEGMRVITGFETKKVEKRGERFYLTGSHAGEEVVLDAEQLLVATGRRPNTADMGLEEAGVRLERRGEVLVNDRLQTENPDVYAAGDVLGEDMFVYVAAYGGILAAENALVSAGRVYDTSTIPRVTFTDPQIASAGLTEDQAREEEYEVQVSTLPMAQVPRALAAHDTRGLIKLVVDGTTNRLLGAHILAPEAGEIIQTAVLAMRFGITVEQLRETMFPYLTNVEGIKLAALGLEKDVALLSCCAG